MRRLHTHTDVCYVSCSQQYYPKHFNTALHSISISNFIQIGGPINSIGSKLSFWPCLCEWVCQCRGTCASFAEAHGACVNPPGHRQWNLHSSLLQILLNFDHILFGIFSLDFVSVDLQKEGIALTGAVAIYAAHRVEKMSEKAISQEHVTILNLCFWSFWQMLSTLLHTYIIYKYIHIELAELCVGLVT